MFVNDMREQSVTAARLPAFNASESVAVFGDFFQTLIAGLGPVCVSYLQKPGQICFDFGLVVTRDPRTVEIARWCTSRGFGLAA